MKKIILLIFASSLLINSCAIFKSTKKDPLLGKFNITLFDNQITTEVKKFDGFYKAENYHQGYYKLNTEQPYCNAVITPKVSKARKLLEKYY